MASVHIARWADMEYMFNISAGVGRGRPNHHLDVMLVQYLLNLASDETKSENVTTWTLIRPPDLKNNLVMDGICGEKTQAFISHYQKHRNQTRQYSDVNQMAIVMKVKEDGAIDPWRHPVNLAFQHADASTPLASSLTMATLCYDAAKHDDMTSGFFRLMPDALRRILCAH